MIEDDYFFSGKINMIYETSFDENLGFIGALNTGRKDAFMTDMSLSEEIIVRDVTV